MQNPINLSASDFYQKISSNENAVIIDVRTPQEFNEGHIPNSLLIDIYNPAFQKKISDLEKSKDYYIYCRSGSRSLHAVNFMISQGFKSVQHLADGIISWTEKLDK